MSIWKEIGKALNSTLGTEKFKPLDKLILGEKKFVPQENVVLYSFISQTLELSGDQRNFISSKFIPSLDGQLILQAKIGTEGNWFIYVYEDEKEIIKNENRASEYGTITKTLYVDVKSGSTYHVKVSTNYLYGSRLFSLSLLGMVTDANYFTIESEG